MIPPLLELRSSYIVSPTPSPQLYARTRRRWLPNVQGKRIYSEILGRLVDIKVTTHALRCIDKAGGATHAELGCLSICHEIGRKQSCA